MRRIYAYTISILTIVFFNQGLVAAQDTLDIPLKIRIGVEATGPVIYSIDKKILSAESYVMADLNERRALLFGGGYLDYSYSQYNYEYKAKGFFLKSGIDFNLLKPKKSQGLYFAGIGLHYGLSHYSAEIPSFTQDNYWGTYSSSIGRQSGWAHFVEAAPGVRAEIFRNFSMGWTLNLRLLLHSGSGSDIKPLNLPGFGSGAKSFTTGVGYFLVWNIPYKRIRVIIQPEPEEPEEEPAENPSAPRGINSGGFNP